MLNKSIAYKLSIYISLAVISVFITFILVFYIYNQRTLIQTIEERAKSHSSVISGKVRSYVLTTSEITSNISEQILFYEKSNQAELFISSVIKKYPYLNSIHIRLSDSLNIEQHFYKRTKKNTDSIFVEKLDRFQCIAEKEILDKKIPITKPSWIQPFKCPVNNEIVSARLSPVYIKDINQNSKIAGNIICQLSLVDLNDSINKIKIGERGYVFIIDKDGNYITHPQKEWILTRKVKNIPTGKNGKKNLNVEQIIKSGKSSQSFIVYPDYLNHEKCWLYYSPVKEVGWSIIFIMPYNELFKPLYLATLRMLFISVVGILIIFLIVTFITNKLLKPLKEATNELKKFSNNQGNQQIKTFNEITHVTNSLDFFKSWYESYNIELQRETIQKKHHYQDMEQASEIQMSLMKTSYPAFKNRSEIDLYSVYLPANIVSGDLYDYFFIDEENLIISIGDVSGKGIPAAIFMGISQTIIKSNSTYKKAKTIVNKANKDLCTNNQHQFFLTLFLAVLNVKTGKLNFCNAAHTSAFVIQKNGGIINLNKSHGLPLGIYHDKNYLDSEINIQKGDYLVLFTDGFTEQLNNENVRYGFDQFKDDLIKNQGLKTEEMVKNLIFSINEFKQDQPQTDDMSLLILQFNG